jgi:hypothetical protein
MPPCSVGPIKRAAFEQTSVFREIDDSAVKARQARRALPLDDVVTFNRVDLRLSNAMSSWLRRTMLRLDAYFQATTPRHDRSDAVIESFNRRRLVLFIVLIALVVFRFCIWVWGYTNNERIIDLIEHTAYE